jgi:tRNA (cmo5U34)-methyltransferase
MTDSSTTERFHAYASDYDAARRRLVPMFDTFYDTAVQALELARGPITRVLDLGAGTGLLSERVLAAHPGAELVLLDGAPAMLDEARGLLVDRASYLVGDLTDPLPEGPWDAIVSALAIHHLSDGDKAVLFTRVREALRPGGVFVNAEQVAGATPELEAHNLRHHERSARGLGTDDTEWAAAVERMRDDRKVTVDWHLARFREAGFNDADCLFKDHSFAVLVAWA